jgi:hypothetical protein
VVKTMDNAFYVAAVDQEWRERTVVWGDTECRLYRVMPSFLYVHKGTRLNVGVGCRDLRICVVASCPSLSFLCESLFRGQSLG